MSKNRAMQRRSWKRPAAAVALLAVGIGLATPAVAWADDTTGPGPTGPAPVPPGSIQGGPVIDKVTISGSTMFPAHQPDLVIGADGLPLIAYVHRQTTNLWVSHCGDLACTPAKRTDRLVAEVGNPLEPSLAIRPNGLPVISYYDYFDFSLRLILCGDLTCTNVTSWIMDSEFQSGSYHAVTIGSDGLPVIAYSKHGVGVELRVIHCDNPACNAATRTTVLDDTHVSGVSITKGTNGYPVIAAGTGIEGPVSLLRCLNAVCSSYTTTWLDASDTVHTSVTIGKDNRPVVAYNNSIDNAAVAHCTWECLGVDKYTLDPTRQGNGQVSIAVGRSGSPFVSYYDGAHGNLRIARCGDVKCSTASTMLVDSTGDVGAGSSVALLPDGRQAVAYSDASTGTVKYAVITG